MKQRRHHLGKNCGEAIIVSYSILAQSCAIQFALVLDLYVILKTQQIISLQDTKITHVTQYFKTCHITSSLHSIQLNLRLIFPGPRAKLMASYVNTYGGRGRALAYLPQVRHVHLGHKNKKKAEYLFSRTD